MLKLIGAVIIFVACTWYGLYRSTQYTRTLEQLKEIIYTLKRLKTEIQFNQTELPEAFLNVSVPMKGPMKKFFANLHSRLRSKVEQSTLTEIWDDELQSAFLFSDLKAHHLEVLYQLGRVIGGSNVDDQMDHIDAAIERLELEESQASEEMHKYARLWRGLGAMFGIALIIMLI